MRMRKKTNLVPRMEACAEYWIQNPQDYKGNWRSLMPQCRELRVEVGCGKGEFTVKTAQAEPDILLIAVEIVKDAMVVGMYHDIPIQMVRGSYTNMKVTTPEDLVLAEAFLRKRE